MSIFRDAKQCFKRIKVRDKLLKVSFFGDSRIRQTFLGFNNLVGLLPMYLSVHFNSYKHMYKLYKNVNE